MGVNAPGQVEPVHLWLILVVGEHQIPRHDAGGEDLTVVINVVEEHVERADPLDRALRQCPPLVGGEHPRHHVERDQALRAALAAIDQEGDAEAAEQHRRLVVLLAQPLGRQLLEPARETRIGRARRAVGHAHLVEARWWTH